SLLADEVGDQLAIRSVDERGFDPPVVRLVCDRLGAAGVVIGDDEVLEEVTPKRRRDNGAADAAGADDEDSHQRRVALVPRAPPVSTFATTRDGARRCPARTNVASLKTPTRRAPAHSRPTAAARSGRVQARKRQPAITSPGGVEPRAPIAIGRPRSTARGSSA